MTRAALFEATFPRATERNTLATRETAGYPALLLKLEHRLLEIVPM